MAGVTFTPKGVERIKKAVNIVLGMPQDRTGERTRTTPTQTQFWAALVGTDVTGLRHRFVRVNPVAARDQADFVIGREAALYYEIAGDRAEEGWAREANGVRGLALFTVVKVEFIGYDADDLPAYLFTAGNSGDSTPLQPHDHRDNDNGGFAFATYHLGTGLPQQPWLV